MQRLKFGPLVWKIPLEEEMATHSSILAWRIPWTLEPGGLQSKGSHRVGHARACRHNFISGISYLLELFSLQNPRTPRFSFVGIFLTTFLCATHSPGIFILFILLPNPYMLVFFRFSPSPSCPLTTHSSQENLIHSPGSIIRYTEL